MTIYTGNSSVSQDIIVGSDVEYASGLNGDDLLALIASGEIWINPNAIGSDGVLTIYASTLNQSGSMHLVQRCLDSGSCLVEGSITTYGSNASLGTGNLAVCVTADYNFDERLDILRPPFFPVLDNAWTFTNWREIPEPCWVESGGCP